MKIETKNFLAVAAFIVASIIALASLTIPPEGVIDSSALWAIAQFLVMVCTLLGIDATLQKFMAKK